MTRSDRSGISMQKFCKSLSGSRFYFFSHFFSAGECRFYGARRRAFVQGFPGKEQGLLNGLAQYLPGLFALHGVETISSLYIGGGRPVGNMHRYQLLLQETGIAAKDRCQGLQAKVYPCLVVEFPELFQDGAGEPAGKQGRLIRRLKPPGRDWFITEDETDALSFLLPEGLAKLHQYFGHGTIAQLTGCLQVAGD